MCKDGRVSHERNSVLIVQKIRMITGNNNILLQFITSIFIFKHEKSGSVFIWFYKKVINLRKTGRAHLSLSLSAGSLAIYPAVVFCVTTVTHKQKIKIFPDELQV